MKISQFIKQNIAAAVAYLYIFLFTYAAIAKLLDFENFQTQLGLSPLLSAFADFISYAVLAVEFFIATMLSISKLRIVGLYSGFALMVMFSAYIFIILHYSSFVPCSCGGILEKLGWTQHLVFNLAFVGLGAFAILIHGRRNVAHANEIEKTISEL